MFPHLRTCCGCMDLAVGAKAISIIFTLLEVFGVLMYGTPIIKRLQLPPVTLVFYEIMAIISIVQIFAGILLIIGVFRKSPRLMTLWALVAFWRNVALVLLVIVGSGWYVHASMKKEIEEEEDKQLFIIMLCYVIYALTTYYAASVVSSYRMLLSAGTPLHNVKEEVTSVEEANLV